MADHLSYRDYLNKIYQSAKKLVADYSYLQFSDDLGFSETNVSWLIVTGRRALTPSSSAKIIKALALKGDDKKYFLALVAYNNAREPEKREKLFQKLMELKSRNLDDQADQKALEYFSEWYHPVIREMTSLEEFQSDPIWITQRLYNKLMPKQAKESLELLERLGLITYAEDRGRHVPSGGHVMPDRSVELMAAARFHQKMMEIARESVTRVETKRRDLNAMTICISEESVDSVKKLIDELYRKVLEIESNDGKRDGVYQLNFQFFPFTKQSG